MHTVDCRLYSIYIITNTAAAAALDNDVGILTCGQQASRYSTIFREEISTPHQANSFVRGKRERERSSVSHGHMVTW